MSKSLEKSEQYIVPGRNKRILQYGILSYLTSFIPSAKWIPNYQKRWLLGDIISGITLGLMTVPQALAYAHLANIPVQYGLYSAFIGHLVYAFLGTSREISVGPLAVPGVLIAKAVFEIEDAFPGKYTPAEIGASLGLLFGITCLGFGMFRLGVILDLIPNAVIVGFTTGLAIYILTTQFAPLLGIKLNGPSNTTWDKIEKSIMGIPRISWHDLVFGLVSLLFLFGMRFLASKFGKRLPIITYIAVGANAVLVILATIISTIIFSTNPDFQLSIIKKVPSGFGPIGLPTVNTELWGKLVTHVPGLFLAICLETSAIAKGFSRKVGYEMAPSQEVFALGACNVAVTFFSGFPSGGAVSRAAVFDRSGVKTPLAGLFVSLIVLASFEFLTPCFYYIPNATLAAIIFRAGLSLFPSQLTLRRFWNAHPIDLVQFFIASLVTFFFGAEYGIGAAVIGAFLFLLYRLARPQILEICESKDTPNLYVDKESLIKTKPLGQGILAFRVQESLIFPNISYVVDQIVNKCLLTSIPSSQEPCQIWSMDIYSKAERIREINAKINGTSLSSNDKLSPLKAVILDLSAVNWIDSSGLRGLEDLVRQLKSYAGPSFQFYLISTHSVVVACLLRTGIGYIARRPRLTETNFDDDTTGIPVEARNSLILEGHLGPSQDETFVSCNIGFPIHPSVTSALDSIIHA